MSFPAAEGGVVAGLLEQRARDVFRPLPKALAGSVDAIHDLRVAARRLRVALPLLARKPAGRRTERALQGLRALTRTAGASRDLDVGLRLLEDRVRATAAPAPELLLLRRRLRGARRRAKAAMVEALLDVEVAGLRRDLRALAARTVTGAFAVLLRLRPRKDEEAAALAAELGALGARFDPEALHGVRRRIRRLRYLGEVAGALRKRPFEAAAAFKDLQERLGRLHDLYVLSVWLGEEAAAAEARGALPVAEHARQHQAALLAESQAVHAEWLGLGPAELVRRAVASLDDARTAA